MADDFYQTRATFAAAALREMACRMGWDRSYLDDAMGEAVSEEATAWNNTDAKARDAYDEATSWAKTAPLDKLVAECAAAIERDQRRAAKLAARAAA